MLEMIDYQNFEPFYLQCFKLKEDEDCDWEKDDNNKRKKSIGVQQKSANSSLDYIFITKEKVNCIPKEKVNSIKRRRNSRKGSKKYCNL